MLKYPVCPEDFSLVTEGNVFCTKLTQNPCVTSVNNLGGVASYDDIYAQIKILRDDLTPRWKATVRQVIQSHSSDSRGFSGTDLFYSVNGLGGGFWGVRANLVDTPVSRDADDGTEGIENPVRSEVKTYRILRDSSLARRLKLLHQNRCQICNHRIDLGEERFYSEAHHIIPLGRPHNGPDILSNIIVLCPNHHVMFDYGAIPLVRNDITAVNGHVISQDSIDYHNQNIYVQ